MVELGRLAGVGVGGGSSSPPSPAQNLPEGIKGSPDLRTCLLPYLLALGPVVGLFQLRTLSHKGVLLCFFFLNLNYIPSYLQALKGSTQIKPVLPHPPHPSIIGFLELGAKGPPDQSSSHCQGGGWAKGVGGGLGRLRPGPPPSHCQPQRLTSLLSTPGKSQPPACLCAPPTSTHIRSPPRKCPDF